MRNRVKPVVDKILLYDENARMDDNYLILRVIQELEPELAGTTFANVMFGLKFKGISMESITRARRKFFETYPYLKVDKVEKARRRKELEYREEYGHYSRTENM